MTNPQITTDLATILERIEAKIDKQNDKIDKLSEQINELKVEQAKVSEKLQSIEDKIKVQDKRLDSIEFVNRGIFVGLTLAVLGGFAKIFGFIGNSP